MIKETVVEYDVIFDEKDYDKRANDAQSATDNYYTLVTEFYEKGWGESFHFAPRFKGESFEESIVRHEHFLAIKLGLGAGDRVLDVGCGVMGPARNIARISGANITGLTINEHQVKRCQLLNSKTSVSHLLDVKQGDFMAIPFEDNSFDKMYAIEALCHAPDLKAVYQQVYNKLKPGGKACFYEWAMTDKFDPKNKEHVKYKEMIEYGNSICELKSTREIDQYIDEVGFIKEECVDLVDTNYGNDHPWYTSLQSGWSLSQIRHTKFARLFTQGMLKTFETVRIFPQGISKAHNILLVAADGLVGGGIHEIFTPMYMVVVRKPA